MQDSTQSKPRSRRVGKTAGLPFIPRPRTLGGFVILITALAFIAGRLRNELALTLLGTVFFAILGFCFTGIFLLGLFHRRKIRTLSLLVTPEKINRGGEAELCVRIDGKTSPRKNRFAGLPAILMRCELYLETRDGRVIRHFTEPDPGARSSFCVKERGAYFSNSRPGGNGGFVIFDAPGFFRLSFPLRGNESPRLFALPVPAEETAAFSLKSGGSERRNEAQSRKSDELIDHRPYIPGDDPRRINWKLYGHAPLGELFVREGENEPPPRSRLLMLIDTEADRSLYSPGEGRRAVDLLCESALAAALELSGQGTDILIGYTGGGLVYGKDGPENTEPDGAADFRTVSGSGGASLRTGEFAEALSLPAAISWPASPEGKSRFAEGGRRTEAAANLPRAPGDRGVLIFALPRSSSESSALDRFLKNREIPKQGFAQETDIVFLYNTESERAGLLEESARVCVNLYNGRSGVHAAILRRSQAGEESTFEKTALPRINNPAQGPRGI